MNFHIDPLDNILVKDDQAVNLLFVDDQKEGNFFENSKILSKFTLSYVKMEFCMKSLSLEKLLNVMKIP